MTNFEEKIRPRIVLTMTIHRENFYRVDLINLTFHFDINFFAKKLPVVFSFCWLFFHSARCFLTINQFDWSKFEKCCNLIGKKFSSWIVSIKHVVDSNVSYKIVKYPSNILFILFTVIILKVKSRIIELELPHKLRAQEFPTSSSLTSAVSSNASVPSHHPKLAIFTFSSNGSCRNMN
jgi:hypothetical protein